MPAEQRGPRVTWGTQTVAPMADEAVASPARKSDPKADDRTMYSGMVAIEDSPNGLFGIFGHKLETAQFVTRDALNQDEATNPKRFVDGNGKWGEPTDSPRQKGAVDAAYDSQETLRMYRNVLNADLIAILGGGTLNANVHLCR